MHKKGFTLIELLIVIAIIGILAGAVVVSLGDTTEAAKDATDKATLTSLRPLTILHIAGNGNSSEEMCLNTNQGFATSDNEIDATIGKLNANRGANGGVWCFDADDPGPENNEWVIFMALLGDTDNAFCMDNKGSVATIPKADIGEEAISCTDYDVGSSLY